MFFAIFTHETETRNRSSSANKTDIYLPLIIPHFLYHIDISNKKKTYAKDSFSLLKHLYILFPDAKFCGK